jgi:hypothetical protein
MIWIAPSERDNENGTLEKPRWESAELTQNIITPDPSQPGTLQTNPEPEGLRLISPGQRPGNPVSHHNSRPEGAQPGSTNAWPVNLELER